MKKIIPVLFVSATTLIAVVGVCGSFNGSYRQLRAEDHEHTIEFKSADITNPSVDTSGYTEVGTFTVSKKPNLVLILALLQLLRAMILN